MICVAPKETFFQEPAGKNFHGQKSQGDAE